jgi:hypothetical protein
MNAGEGATTGEGAKVDAVNSVGAHLRGPAPGAAGRPLTFSMARYDDTFCYEVVR